MKKLFILMIFAFICNINAQSIKEVYTQYLPKQALESEQLKNMAFTNLEKAIGIHPDIIYSYLYFLEAQVSTGNKDDVKSLMAHYNDLIKYYNKKKYDWANRLYNSIKASSEDEQVKIGLLNHFSDIMLSIKNDFKEDYSGITIDSNKIHFHAMLFYSKDKNIKYDQSVNYYGDRLDAENGIINEIKGNDTDNMSETLEKVNYYWFLFEKLPYDEQKNILMKKLNFEHKIEKNAKKIGIGATFTYDGVISYENQIQTPIESNIPLQKEITNKSVGFSLSYNLYFKETKTFLSYLRIEAGFSMGTGSDQIYTPVYYEKSKTVSADQLVTTERITNITGGNIKFSRNMSLFLKLNIPLLYLSKRLSVEASAMAFYNSYKYDANITYYYSNSVKTYTYLAQYDFWTYKTVTKSGYGSLIESSTKTNFKLLPLLNINYEFTNSINLNLSGFADYYNVQLQYWF